MSGDVKVAEEDELEQLEQCDCDWDLTVEELLERDDPIEWVRLISQNKLDKAKQQMVVDAVCRRRLLFFESLISPVFLAERSSHLDSLATIFLHARSTNDLWAISDIIRLAPNLESITISCGDDIKDAKADWECIFHALMSSMVQSFSASVPREAPGLLADCSWAASTLKSLDLSGTVLNIETEIQAIRTLLLRSTCLEALNLKHVDLQPGAIAAMSDGLASCLTLVQIDLSGNYSIRPECIFHLSQAVCNRQMKAISFEPNCVGIILGCAFIIQTVDNSILHIQETHDSVYRLCDEDAKIIALAVNRRARNRQNVLTLYLDKLLGLTPKGITLLSETMKSNPSVIIYPQALSDQELKDYKFRDEFAMFDKACISNVDRLDDQYDGWVRVSFAIAFARANWHHPFLPSFIPLARIICSLCNLSKKTK